MFEVFQIHFKTNIIAYMHTINECEELLLKNAIPSQ